MFLVRLHYRWLIPLAACLQVVAALPLRVAAADEWRGLTAAEMQAGRFGAWSRTSSPQTLSTHEAAPSASAAPTSDHDEHPAPSHDAPPANASPAPANASAASAPTEPEAATEVVPPQQTQRSPPTLSLSAQPGSTDPLADLPGAEEIARMATATGVVIVIAVLALTALRHYRGASRGRLAPERKLQLHGAVSLGGRNGLHLVSVTDRQFLVAVDARGVSCITAIPAGFGELCGLDDHSTPADGDDPFAPIGASSQERRAPDA